MSARRISLCGTFALLAASLLMVAHYFFNALQGQIWYEPLVLVLQLTFIVCIFVSARIQKRTHERSL